MPPIPPFDGLHPILVHFPIALLAAAPALLAAALLLRSHRAGLILGSLLLAAGGVGGAWLSVATGEEAAEIAERGAPDATERALELHEESAERAALAATVLLAAQAALFAWPRARRGELSRGRDLALHGALLLGWAGGGALLAKAGHEGGLLVHGHGIRARLAPGEGAAPAVRVDGDGDDDDDDDGGRRRRGR